MEIHKPCYHIRKISTRNSLSNPTNWARTFKYPPPFCIFQHCKKQVNTFIISHIGEITEKFPQLKFECNVTMRAVTNCTIVKVDHKCHTIITSSLIAVMSSHDYSLNLSAPKLGVDKYIIICPNFWETIIHNMHPEFLAHFWKLARLSQCVWYSTDIA